MTKEESDLIITEQNKSTEEILKAVAKVKSDYHELFNLKDMRIAELEEKISVLLSCKNCSENKGGFICQKEYENKCLAQKIQYIKELQEENAELKSELTKKADTNHSLVKQMADLESENAELKEDNCKLNRKVELLKEELIKPKDKCYSKDKEQLTKAKEIIKKFSEFVNNEIEYDPEHPQEHTDLWNKLCEHAEQFLREIRV